LAVILFLVGYYYVDQYIWFSRGTWTFMAVPTFEILGMFLASTLYKYFTEERERKKVKGVFQAYLSPDVIEQVLEDGDLSLGGKRMDITLYFSDLRDFTTISESLSPEKLVEFMNTYFTPMTAAILKSGGTLDKYIGDAIMAFWGAPIPLPDQADRAAKVAITHLWELDKLQVDLPARGFPKPDFGIGLNSGPASVGNMGSAERLAYTALGDHVNLAARLEGLTKDYGIKILMSEFTQAKLTSGMFFSRDLDDIRPKGKNKPVKVFELMRPDMLKGDKNAIANLIGEFELGRKAYLARDWAKAERHFGECIKLNPSDGPASLYLERIADYKAEPPAEAWDSVYTFKHK
jgi:adenylate cyclase